MYLDYGHDPLQWYQIGYDLGQELWSNSPGLTYDEVNREAARVADEKRHLFVDWVDEFDLLSGFWYGYGQV